LEFFDEFFFIQKKKLASYKPANSLNKVEFKVSTGPRRVLSKIRSSIRKNHYRNDLKTTALRRASALLRGQRPRAAAAASTEKKNVKKAE
jgi:large subunit ribosomal protein L28e